MKLRAPISHIKMPKQKPPPKGFFARRKARKTEKKHQEFQGKQIEREIKAREEKAKKQEEELKLQAKKEEQEEKKKTHAHENTKESMHAYHINNAAAHESHAQHKVESDKLTDPKKIGDAVKEEIERLNDPRLPHQSKIARLKTLEKALLNEENKLSKIASTKAPKKGISKESLQKRQVFIRRQINIISGAIEQSSKPKKPPANIKFLRTNPGTMRKVA